MKQQNKSKILTSLLVLLLLGMASMVQAQQNKYSINTTSLSKFSNSEMEQARNNFQNRYENKYNGTTEFLEQGENIQARISEQKRFLFWDVNTIETYDLTDDGSEILNVEKNFWARILNRNRFN